VTIKLGTNDSRRYYWNTANFIADYKAMIDTLTNNILPKPTIRPCLPIPAYPSGFVKYGINDTMIRDSVIPAIKVVAQAKGLSIIDLYTPMQNKLGTLVPADDGVHPNAAGQDTLAHLLYRDLSAITAALSPTPKSSGTSQSTLLRRIHAAGAGAISLELNDPGAVTVTLMTAAGRVAAVTTFTGKGIHFIRTDPAMSGLCIVRLTSDLGTVVRKIVVLK
jgi:hypothetical protein